MENATAMESMERQLSTFSYQHFLQCKILLTTLSLHKVSQERRPMLTFFVIRAELYVPCFNIGEISPNQKKTYLQKSRRLVFLSLVDQYLNDVAENWQQRALKERHHSKAFLGSLCIIIVNKARIND
uniref:Uncharacterized protein n=1 Tax=Romanomermis culicivorax TaxID=13658 RepID=A0A915JWP3_ROMCU